jgi:uncharacterized protein YndB with AHSA1/START domain
MNEATPPIAPVRATVKVPVLPERAYELFSRDLGAWWPLSTHSVGLERSMSVSVGRSVGEPIVETLRDGTTAVWGTILELEPPNRITFNWHAGRSADLTTLVEVTFSADSEGSTIVELVHSGWERWADGSSQAAGYQEGWPLVLEAYVEGARGGA